MRDGDWLVGWGCATALYPTHIGPAAARVRLMPNGDVRVQIAAHEIGNGVYTVLGQMAAERLGVDLSSVTVEVGDSRLPPAPVAGGSNTTASACNAVLKTCDAIRAKLFHAAVTANDGPLAGTQRRRSYAQGRQELSPATAPAKTLTTCSSAWASARSRNMPNSFPKGLKPDAVADLYAGQADA